MGIFGNNKPEPAAPEKTHEEMIASALAEKTGGRLDGRSVFYDKYGIEVTVARQEINYKSGAYSAMAVFMLRCRARDFLTIEKVGAYAVTMAKACTALADAIAPAAQALMEGFEKAGSLSVKNSFDGTEHVYFYNEKPHYHKMGGISLNSDLFGPLKDMIKDYLGNEKYNWVKLDVLCGNGNINAQVWVNGSPYVELDSALIDLVKKAGSSFMLSETQYVLLTQQEATLEKPGYTDEQLMALAKTSIHLMGEIKSSDDKLKAYERIKELCHDDSLAFELYTFIPEICAEIMTRMNVKSGVQINAGSKVYKVHVSQLRAWGIAFREMLSVLGDEKPDEDFQRGLLFSSARFYAFKKAVDSGAPRHQILLPDLLCEAFEGYKITI